MIDLDKFSHYKTDGNGGVKRGNKNLKIKNKNLISNIVYLTCLEGKRYTISVARLTFHQMIRKLKPTERVYVNSNCDLDYLDRLQSYEIGDFNPNMVKKLTILEKEELCYKYQNDVVIIQLAKDYRVSSETVRVVLRGNSAGCSGSYLYRKRCPLGGKRGDYLKKVNDEVVERIMELYGQNKSKAAIGRELNLSAETVSKYIKREEERASGANN